ncbi:anti-sigma factor [Ekhidna sp.]
MNIEEYISSGTLESYVMDELTPTERTEVENAASQHPEIKEELQKIELSIEALAFATAVNPPSDIKDKLVAKIANEPNIEKEAPVIEMKSKESFGFLKLAAAASIIVAIGSAFMAFNYWSKWQSAEDRLSTLIAQNEQFADNYNHVNQQLGKIQNAVSIMNNSAFKRVTLNGTENSPEALATVYWNETSAAVYLSIQNLKELSKDQQYQLWAIIDGKPVDVGVFDSASNGLLVQMKNAAPNTAAFAVTVEPRGGSENPSLETMQVIGNV